jgi:hypothetical protein
MEESYCNVQGLERSHDCWPIVLKSMRENCDKKYWDIVGFGMLAEFAIYNIFAEF